MAAAAAGVKSKTCHHKLQSRSMPAIDECSVGNIIVYYAVRCAMCYTCEFPSSINVSTEAAVVVQREAVELDADGRFDARLAATV